MSNVIISVNNHWQQPQPRSNQSQLDSQLHAMGERFPAAFNTKKVSNSEFEAMIRWAERLNANGVTNLIVVGMGGSSLGAKTIASVLRNKQKEIFFWEGTHPAALLELVEKVKHSHSAMLWVSKSGTTLESTANLSLFREIFPQIEESYVTSNPKKIAPFVSNKENIFHLDEELGGRYSVISPVGLLPALFLDGDIRTLVSSFEKTNDKNHISIPFNDNPAKQLAYDYYNLLAHPYTKVNFWFYAKELYTFGEWLRQLWAESLGKNPMTNADISICLGPEDQHSVLQNYTEGKNNTIHNFFHVRGYGQHDMLVPDLIQGDFANKSLSQILDSQMQSIELALNETARPVSRHIVPEINLHHLGKIFSFWMNVVTYLGYFMGVNPFDQPGVELGKVYCKKLLNDEQKKPDSVVQQKFEY